MADKIKSGQTVLIDKMSYELRDIKRFDVVVYRSDLSKDEYIIKRVIGLPGEEIQIIDSRIYINGEALKAVQPVRPLRLERMNILLWEITAISVRIADLNM